MYIAAKANVYETVMYSTMNQEKLGESKLIKSICTCLYRLSRSLLEIERDDI